VTRRDRAVNRLVAVPATGGEPVVLRQVADFVMSPRLDQLGELLAWIEWSHPDMPWDSTELWVGRLDRRWPSGAGRSRHRRWSRAATDESIVQPEWDPTTACGSVRTAATGGTCTTSRTPGPPSGEPVGVAAGPTRSRCRLWVFGESRYAFLSDNRVVFAYVERRRRPSRACTTRSPTGSTGSGAVHLDPPGAGMATTVIFVGASFTADAAVVAGDRRAQRRDLRARGDASARHRERSQLGAVLGRPTDHVPDRRRHRARIFYPPTNPDFVAPEGERPPLIVMIHGGPTSAAPPSSTSERSTGRHGASPWST
jgi:hypothetical protein